MKKTFNIIMTVVLTYALLFMSTMAADFRANSFLLGQTVFHTGTNSITIYPVSTTYATNVYYTNSSGSIVYQGSTNATTSAINGFTGAVAVGCDPNTGESMPASIAIDYEAVGFTNTLTLTFARSVDGSTFDTNLNTFSFTTPVASGTRYTTITNLPSVFLYGAKYIRLQALAFPTNGAIGGTSTTVGTNYTTIRGLTFNGFYP